MIETKTLLARVFSAIVWIKHDVVRADLGVSRGRLSYGPNNNMFGLTIMKKNLVGQISVIIRPKYDCLGHMKDGPY